MEYNQLKEGVLVVVVNLEQRKKALEATNPVYNKDRVKGTEGVILAVFDGEWYGWCSVEIFGSDNQRVLFHRSEINMSNYSSVLENSNALYDWLQN